MPFVYVIQEVPIRDERTNPWLKIGYTKNPPEWRLNANLKRGNPRRLVIAAAFEYASQQEARQAERAAHNAFEEFAGEKEWFQLRPEPLIAWFIENGGVLRGTAT